MSLTGWRRQVAELYAGVRATPDPEAAHQRWVAGRDHLFRTHRDSPLRADDPLRRSGLPVWPYDPRFRFLLAPCPVPAADAELREVDLGADGVLPMRRVATLALPEPVAAPVDVWWLEQYGGGLFVPLRDGTAGRTSYGAGRYLLDTAKGADLGAADGRLVVDLNFLYHPSCRYDPAWTCPLAAPGSRVEASVEVGERLP